MQPLWILAKNDGEAVEIRRLLDEVHEKSLLTLQPWGASWSRLEPEICTALPGNRVFGIELSGPAPYGAVNIDHHNYPRDSRWNEKSSLEQVAARLAVRLNRWRKLVAANDRGYIPAMKEELCATPQEIEEVRRFDRRAQGVTRQMELEAWKSMREIAPPPRLWTVKVEGTIHSAYADLLYMVCGAREWLLQSEDQWAYSGPRHKQLMSLNLEESHWSGGAEASGYFGIVAPGVISAGRILRALI